jgi:predicted PurR-regulated permease PerM
MAQKNSLQVHRSVWEERRDIPLTILAWFAVVAIIFVLLSHIGHTIFLLAIAAILAYALVPAVIFFSRFLPRYLAIILVYILVMFGLGFIVYLTLDTAVNQVGLLIKTVQTFLTPKGEQSVSPLIFSLQNAGLSHEQIADASHQITSQLEQLSSGIIPFLHDFFNSVIDIFITAILSIYLLMDGERLVNWVKKNMPVSQRGRLQFFLNTLQRIVGGYIRGQFLLSVIIGVLVGIGMFLFQIPYAVLLGLLAFILSFIPILGTFISGAACVLVALTKGWFIAVLVLIYFIVIHVIEGDILGPRIVGRALGLHPVISILAVITGSELFGIGGALFSAPIAGVVQAFLVATWSEWKMLNPEHFTDEKKKMSKKITKLL